MFHNKGKDNINDVDKAGNTGTSVKKANHRNTISQITTNTTATTNNHSTAIPKTMCNNNNSENSDNHAGGSGSSNSNNVATIKDETGASNGTTSGCSNSTSTTTSTKNGLAPSAKTGTTTTTTAAVATAAAAVVDDTVDDNASSDMNEVDFDDAKTDGDKNEDLDSPSLQGSPGPTLTDKDGGTPDKMISVKKKKSREMSKAASVKLMMDKKKLEQYIGEGEVLVPVPRARRRVKGSDLGYMVKRGHAVTRYIDKDGIVYNPADTAYLKNKEKGKPYFVCAIQRFNLTKRDTLMVVIKWFFRLSEVPGSVYHHLTLDRELHRKNGEDIICDSSIQQRELFSSEATDTLPITSLRGKCHVVQYTDLKSACSFVPRPDHFFYILAYRPDNRRLATTQGEIRVGPSHQARLPECRPGTSPNDMPENPDQWEEIRWRPNKVVDGDLLMYLRAARSIAAFAGMCGGTAEDRCEAEAMDETTVNALDTLHKHNYDTSKSMQALVKGPSVMYIERKWSEEDMKRFAKGVRHHGKNFFKIRKEHLPHKDTSELVEFYYFWKKSPAANSARPAYRSRHRRQLKRQSPRTSVPDICEASTGSDSGGEESEESDASRDVTTVCSNCFTTSSRDWHNAGKDGAVVCSKCNLVYKKYGDESSSGNNRNLESPSSVSSPYHFRPVPQDEDNAPPSKHNMRTRRSNTSTTTNGKKKERTSSPDLENSSSSISSSTAGGSRSDRKSPSNTNDKELEEKAFNQKSKDSGISKSKKRRFDTEEDSSRKKKKDRSDSESGSESSSVSGPDGIGHDGESDANNQEELSDSSRPSSPTSSIEPVRPQPTSSTSSIQLGPEQAADKPAYSTPNAVGSSSPVPSNQGLTKDNQAISSGPYGLGVLSKDNPVIPPGPLGISVAPVSSKLISSQGVPFGINPFLHSSNLPPVSSDVLGQPSASTPPGQQSAALAHPPLSSSSSLGTLPGIPSSQHLRSSLHTANSNQFIRPTPGVGSANVGHIANIGTITNTSNHPIGSISANNTSVACNFSPLVIPSPALSRASSTGTFIPRTELAIPSLSNATSSGTDSIATAVAKTSSVVTSVDSATSSSHPAQRAPASNPLGLAGTGPNPNASSNRSDSNSSTAVSTTTNPYSRMQREGHSPSDDHQDKKPVLPHPVPSHMAPPPPSSFLPGHPGAGVPFSPFHHYYYPQHPGAPHLLPHPSLHPASVVAAAAAAGIPSSASAPSSSSSSGPSNPTAPPPVPSLVPIKKEAHSPPPPLKPSSDSKSQSDLLTSSSLHALHRSLPPSDGAKVPPGFPQTGLPPSTVPIPPPPLTIIDHRDGKQSDDLSKSSDHYAKDSASSNSLRGGLNPSPHRPEGCLPPGALLHQSRMDSNLSILSESREIGLKSGINLSSSSLPPPSSSSSSSSSSQPSSSLHPHVTSIKEEPNSGLPPHHPVSSAAFQPYPHHHPHMANPGHHLIPPSAQLPPQGPSASSSSVSSSSGGSSVLQVPQPPPPHLSSGDHHHHLHHAGLPPHHMDTGLHPASAAGRPGELLANIKKEPVGVEEIHVDDEDDEPSGGSTTPGPPPTICNREFYKSNSAIFIKVFDRGDRNQCSRTDFIFKPLSGSNLAKKREERIRKASQSSASSSLREEKKRVETPPRATSASESQKLSSSSSGNQNAMNNNAPGGSGMHPGPHTPYQDRHTPRQFTDTPALRQLHEYARPHVLNADPRAGPYSIPGLQHHPHMDPLIGYRLGMFPPGSRERLELELERDKRERDAREREMRERELREMELRDKMELKPGLDRLLPPGAASQLTDAASWLDLQRRMGLAHGGGGGSLGAPPGHSPSGVGSHVPGVYPPSSLATDLLAREREKLDRFGLATNLPQLAADMSYASAVERLSQERQAAERQAAQERERDRERLVAYANDPGARLQLAAANAAAAAAATQHAHTHTHAHSHTHLHLHQQEVAAAHAQAVAQAQAHGLTPPAFPLSLGGHGHPLYPHHPHLAPPPPPGGDPSAPGMPPATSANQLSVLPPGIMHHPLLAGVGNREELLQREIYSRSGHFIDPALAHQLSAQAAAHEALQRQIAIERERFGSSGHLPH